MDLIGSGSKFPNLALQATVKNTKVDSEEAQRDTVKGSLKKNNKSAKL